MKSSGDAGVQGAAMYLGLPAVSGISFQHSRNGVESEEIPTWSPPIEGCVFKCSRNAPGVSKTFESVRERQDLAAHIGFSRAYWDTGDG